MGGERTGVIWDCENMLNPLLQSHPAFIPIARPRGSRQVESLAIIWDFRLRILDLRSASLRAGSRLINCKKTINEPLAVGRRVSSKETEILSQQAARKNTLKEIKLTERSDIHKYSIINIQ
jgi:hypothetical protein